MENTINPDPTKLINKWLRTTDRKERRTCNCNFCKHTQDELSSHAGNSFLVDLTLVPMIAPADSISDRANFCLRLRRGIRTGLPEFGQARASDRCPVRNEYSALQLLIVQARAGSKLPREFHFDAEGSGFAFLALFSAIVLSRMSLSSQASRSTIFPSFRCLSIISGTSLAVTPEYQVPSG